jgi:hypothetical protein
MASELTMYCVTHKSLDWYAKGRTPIFVGSGENKKGYLSDNTGINISKKNPNYCELTAFYWIWKNDHHSKYVSIEHYRRYFFSKLSISAISNWRMKRILNKNDIVETVAIPYDTTIRGYYERNHYGSDLKVVEESTNKFYPDYIDSFHKIMYGSRTSMCNMIAMSKENFDRYCEWLFTILEYVEKNIDISDRDKYQQRVYGFLSERLQNVWVDHQNLKVKRLSIYFLQEGKKVSFRQSIHDMFDKDSH